MEQWHNFFFSKKKKFENKNIFFQNFSKFLQVYIKHKDKHKFCWTILVDIFIAHTQRDTYSSYIAAHRS